MFTKLVVFLAKLFVIALLTLGYITPLLALFNLIIYGNLNLLNSITIKYYLLSYLVGFILLYLYTVDWKKKTENE